MHLYEIIWKNGDGTWVTCVSATSVESAIRGFKRDNKNARVINCAKKEEAEVTP